MSGWAVRVAPERLSPWNPEWALAGPGVGGTTLEHRVGGPERGLGGEWTAPDVRSAPELVQGLRVGRMGEVEPWALARLRALRGSLGESSVSSRAGWVARGQGHWGGCA